MPRKRTVPAVSVGALVAAAERLGASATDLLASARLDPSALADPETPMDGRDLLTVLAFLPGAKESLPVGVLAAEALPDETFPLLERIVANAPTVGEALERAAKYLAYLLPVLSVEVAEGEKTVVLTVKTALHKATSAALCELALALLLVRARRGAGEIPVQSMTFRGTWNLEPRTEIYARVFGGPVAAGDDEQVVLAREVWDRPIAQPAVTPGEALAPAAVALVEDALAFTAPSAKQVAARLGCSGAVMKKALAAIGLSFKDLVKQARATVAERELRRGDLAVHDIAWLTGFRSTSAFAKDFLARTGTPPEDFAAPTQAPVCPVDPERQGWVAPCLDDQGAGDPDEEWGGVLLARSTVVLACGRLGLAHRPARHVHDDAELARAQAWGEQLAQVLGGVDLGMASEAPALAEPYFAAALADRPPAGAIDAALVREVFGPSLAPSTEIQIEALDAVDEPWAPKAAQWFEERGTFVDVKRVAVGGVGVDEDLGSVFLRLIVGLTPQGSLAGVVVRVVWT